MVIAKVTATAAAQELIDSVGLVAPTELDSTKYGKYLRMMFIVPAAIRHKHNTDVSEILLELKYVTDDEVRLDVVS